MKNNERLGNNLLTKKELLGWLNDLLQVLEVFIKINIHSIEELSNGAAFCQLVDVISPGTVRMQKINWHAKL